MRAVVLLVLGCLACGGEVEDDPVDAAPPGADASTERIVVGATDATLELDADIDVTGAGSSLVGVIEVSGGVGEVVVDGDSLPAFVYEVQPWPDAGYTLLQALAVAPDRWYVLWFYCQDGTMTGVYTEGTDGTALAWEEGTGTCILDSGPVTPSIVLPAVDMPWPPLVTGWTASGPELDLPGAGPGTVRIGAVDYQVLPFETVDCTEVCGTPGWYELHALLYDPAAGRACFAIFYFQLDRPGQVTVSYSVTLPDLSHPAGSGLVLPADWTVPYPAGHVAVRPVSSGAAPGPARLAVPAAGCARSRR